METVGVKEASFGFGCRFGEFFWIWGLIWGVMKRRSEWQVEERDPTIVGNATQLGFGFGVGAGYGEI